MEPHADENQNPVQPKGVRPVAIPLPPEAQRVKREAAFTPDGEKKTRYSLPTHLQSHSPVGYRDRVAMTEQEVTDALKLLAMEEPEAFVSGPAPTDAELFEEASLGVMSSRQSTNFKGHQQVVFGPEHNQELSALLGQLSDRKVPVLDGAAYTTVVFTRPYRTAFTMLLTLVGHLPLVSLLTVPLRILRKKFQHINDIPTIGYLQQLHLGILADAMERAAVIASGGKRRAQIHLAPFCGGSAKKNKGVIQRLLALSGITRKERATGWTVGLVAQVGYAPCPDIPVPTLRKLGANLMAFRSERIQPGVNAEERAPEQYQKRQDMDVPDELTVMAGRAAYNAFAHWTRVDREKGKDILILDRVDVLTPGGKERLRAIRQELSDITDKLVKRLPLWVDLPVGRAFSRNAGRGRKAFALVGQRIYIAGLSRPELKSAGIDWDLGVCATGAAAARSALVVELMGVLNLPDNCDLLGGICMMAGPVNQNDIGKEYYGYRDLLTPNFGDRDPTSLLVWTFKAKTVADPIGNEEQLLNAKRKGALVDLRTGPHEVVGIVRDGKRVPFRKRGDRKSTERAFGDMGNFVTCPDGKDIPGNRGSSWPEELRNSPVWPGRGDG